MESHGSEVALFERSDLVTPFLHKTLLHKTEALLRHRHYANAFAHGH